jgi:formate dehydrogenase maturation protein FdhE
MDGGYTARLDFSSAFDEPEQCPGCGSPGLAALVLDERTVFRCRTCESRWRLILGQAIRVGEEHQCESG